LDAAASTGTARGNVKPAGTSYPGKFLQNGGIRRNILQDQIVEAELLDFFQKSKDHAPAIRRRAYDVAVIRRTGGEKKRCPWRLGIDGQRSPAGKLIEIVSQEKQRG
jgi:hypothetical protein